MATGEPTVTDADRQAAAALLDEAMTGGYSYDGANELVARALVAERVKARAPFLELAADYNDGSEWGTVPHSGVVIRERILLAARDPQ